MIALGWIMARAGGLPRMLLIAGCTALASGLLLVAVAILSLPERPEEALFNLVADPGLRGGTTFAIVLLTVPVMLLLYQGIRLGTAARERRFAALRIAGATPNEVRRLGAVVVGIPAIAGAVLGILVYGVLRGLLGGTAMDGPGLYAVIGSTTPAIVPTSVTPTWWQFLLVVAVVGAAGVLIGWRVSGRVILSPLGVTRREQSPPPRPWGLLVLVLAPVALIGIAGDSTSTLAGIAAVGLAVLGVVSLSSWAAYRIGRFAEVHAASPATLLAARRLITEPRPAGRAAAAIGGIALVAGGTAGIAADVSTHGVSDPFYSQSILLVGVGLIMALVAAAGSLAVHSVETLLDRRRAIASLAAAGTPITVLRQAQRHEAALVALPMAAVGVSLGSLAVGVIGVSSFTGLILVLLNAAIVLGLVWAAVHIATRIVQPWLIRAADAGNLRTE